MKRETKGKYEKNNLEICFPLRKAELRYEMHYIVSAGELLDGVCILNKLQSYIEEFISVQVSSAGLVQNKNCYVEDSETINSESAVWRLYY